MSQPRTARDAARVIAKWVKDTYYWDPKYNSPVDVWTRERYRAFAGNQFDADAAVCWEDSAGYEWVDYVPRDLVPGFHFEPHNSFILAIYKETA